MRTFPLFTVLALIVILPGVAIASGSSVNRPPRPPSQQPAGEVRLDNQKYALGKQVFTTKKKRRAIAGIDAGAQAARLRELQKQLPSRDNAGTPHLPALAGTLTNEELDALEHYVANRHRGAR